MNDRIKELAEQAGITTNLDTDYFEKDINKWVDYYSEKFAELIVLECMDVFGKDLPEPGIDGRMTDVIDRICNVAEHFGVDNERTN
jgi:hypothetical protein